MVSIALTSSCYFKVGWVPDPHALGAGADAGAAGKVVELLRAIRTVMTSEATQEKKRGTRNSPFRQADVSRSVPLIFLNLLCIVFLFLLG